MRHLGWKEPDIVLVTGDAYVDHPAFGAAVIARAFESAGYRVAVLPQPDWRTPEAFREFGRPRLFFGITAGNVDSMVNIYSPAKVPRRRDEYAPGGETGKRPPRATIAYTAAAKGAFKGVPVIIGGLEASLRRLAHYDYWDETVRRSMLVDSKADILVWGMGEGTTLEIARRLAAGARASEILDVPGTVVRNASKPEECVELSSFEECAASKEEFSRAFVKWYVNPGLCYAQKHGPVYIVQNLAPEPPTTAELDAIYSLPFTRRPHPRYGPSPRIPAYDMIKDSVTSHRGCAGGCAFCSIFAHQGKRVSSRSLENIIEEVKRMAAEPDFTGTITDIGGPTANMYQCGCTEGWCPKPSCLHPVKCEHFIVRHNRWFEVLRTALRIPGVNHVFIGSGIRHDLFTGRDEKYVQEIITRFTGGHLKVAPEHSVDAILSHMRKPKFGVFREFERLFNSARKKSGKKSYLVPYMISGHPGCTLDDQLALAEFIRTLGWTPKQVQDFIPLPMTLSGAMHYTGKDPLTGEKVHVVQGAEKNEQRALMQFSTPENYNAVKRALIKAGRTDLLGPGPRCLIPYKKPVVTDEPKKPRPDGQRGGGAPREEYFDDMK